MLTLTTYAQKSGSFGRRIIIWKMNSTIYFLGSCGAIATVVATISKTQGASIIIDVPAIIGDDASVVDYFCDDCGAQLFLQNSNTVVYESKDNDDVQYFWCDKHRKPDSRLLTEEDRIRQLVKDDVMLELHREFLSQHPEIEQGRRAYEEGRMT
jgi:hypothetical protein